MDWQCWHDLRPSTETVQRWLNTYLIMLGQGLCLSVICCAVEEPRVALVDGTHIGFKGYTLQCEKTCADIVGSYNAVACLRSVHGVVILCYHCWKLQHGDILALCAWCDVCSCDVSASTDVIP